VGVRCNLDKLEYYSGMDEATSEDLAFPFFICAVNLQFHRHEDVQILDFFANFWFYQDRAI